MVHINYTGEMAKRSSANEVNGFISVSSKPKAKPEKKTSPKKVFKEPPLTRNSSVTRKRSVSVEKTTVNKVKRNDVKSSDNHLHSDKNDATKSTKKPVISQSRLIKQTTETRRNKTFSDSSSNKIRLEDNVVQQSSTRTNIGTKRTSKKISKGKFSEPEIQTLDPRRKRNVNETTSEKRIVDANKSKLKPDQTDKKRSKANHITSVKYISKSRTGNSNAENVKFHDQPSMAPRQRTWTKEDNENSALDHSLMKPTSDGQISSHLKDNDEELSKAGDDVNYDYEDDFEEYESDFEVDLSQTDVHSDSSSECSPSSESHSRTNENIKKRNKLEGQGEEEKKLDSGNYELSRSCVTQESEKKKPLKMLNEDVISENVVISAISSKNNVEKDGDGSIKNEIIVSTESVPNNNISKEDFGEKPTLPELNKNEAKPTQELNLESMPEPKVSEGETSAILNYDTPENQKSNENSSMDSLHFNHSDKTSDAAMARKNEIIEKVNEMVLKSGLLPKELNIGDKLKLKEEEDKSTRGEKILSMVKFKEKSIQLLDLQPMSYELFMIHYSKSDMLQVEVQFPLCFDQETQTEGSIADNKWTQFPIAFHRWSGKDLDQIATFFEDRNGFGSDDSIMKTDWRLKVQKPKYNRELLNKFVVSAGEIVMTLLEEEYSGNGTVEENVDLGFSSRHTLLNIEAHDFLQKKTVTDVKFSPVHPYRLLTVHRGNDLAEDDSQKDIYFSRHVLAVWNILETSQPLNLLVASSEVTSVSFDTVDNKLVYAGLDNGTVCVWDLSENVFLHRTAKTRKEEHVLRVPTYSSACITSELGHTSRIVSIKSIRFKEDLPNDNSIPAQIFTLDEDGRMVVWTLVRSDTLTRHYFLTGKGNPMIPRPDLGKSFWSLLKLSPSTFVNLHTVFNDVIDQMLEITCMSESPGNEHSVLIGSNLGQVARYMLVGKQKSQSLYFDAEETFGSVMCIEPSPTNSQLFLVGSCCGAVRLHKISRKTPLMTFSINDSTRMVSILGVLWSCQKPGLFFVSDDDSNIHLWDLCEGDLYPQFTVPFKKMKITSSALNCKSDYLALAMDSIIQIHILKNDLLHFGSPNIDREKRQFLVYISILDV